MIHAKKTVIIGHIHTGAGEKTHCQKLQWLLNCPLLDIFELLDPYYEPLARLNYDLADLGYPILQEVSLPAVKEIQRRIPPSEVLLLLSWNFSVAAAFGAGLHKGKFLIAKLYAHHEKEKILPRLYEPADVLMTESLLACERAFRYGIPKEKVLHLPHYYPSECEHIESSREYVEKLAGKLKKKIGKKTRIVGCVFRLEYGKNCEYALEAIRYLASQGKDIALVLKGDFSKESPYPDYQEKLAHLLKIYEQENWLLWDREAVSFPQVLYQYASFDVLLHPSGAEAGSHIITECLGLNKPVVALECSTNPYLFRGLVTFVKTKGEIIQAQLPFYLPDMDDLINKLEEDIPPPDRSLVRNRFGVEQAKRRLEILFGQNREKFLKAYEDDRRLFQI